MKIISAIRHAWLKIQEWRRARNVARFRKIFGEMLKDPSSGAAEIVNHYAMMTAQQMVTNWLNKKRILHCEFCPGTEQLHVHNGRRFCGPHLAMVKEKEAHDKQLEDEAREAVA